MPHYEDHIIMFNIIKSIYKLPSIHTNYLILLRNEITKPTKQFKFQFWNYTDISSTFSYNLIDNICQDLNITLTHKLIYEYLAFIIDSITNIQLKHFDNMLDKYLFVINNEFYVLRFYEHFNTNFKALCIHPISIYLIISYVNFAIKDIFKAY
jgi:hypothetical protein